MCGVSVAASGHPSRGAGEREIQVRSHLSFSHFPPLSLCVGIRAIIISGSPGSVNEAPPTSSQGYDPAIFSCGLPVLGICYGMQLIARHYGGKVERGALREDGQFTVTLSTDCLLFDDLEERQEVRRELWWSCDHHMISTGSAYSWRLGG